MGPAPAVASVRNAVRACVTDLGGGDLVLAACSGGADSLALAAALAFVAPRAGLRAGAVTVDPARVSDALDACRSARQADEFNPNVGALLLHLVSRLPAVV